MIFPNKQHCQSNLVGYGEYTGRESILAGNSDVARRGVGSLPFGCNVTDVASGRTFSYDASGNFTLTPQSTDYTPDFLLVQPLRRINASAFLKYDVLDNVELYGRVMYSDLRTRGGRRSGQNPPTRSEEHTSELQSLMRTSYAFFCL